MFSAWPAVKRHIPRRRDIDLHQRLAEARGGGIFGDAAVRTARKLGDTVRYRVGPQLNYFGGFFSEIGTVRRARHQVLDIGSRGQIGKREVAQDFAAIMDSLDGGDGFLAGIDVAEANGVEFEDRGEEAGKNENRDHNLDEGQTGLALHLCGGFHYEGVVGLITVFMGISTCHTRRCYPRFTLVIKPNAGPPVLSFLRVRTHTPQN